MFGSRMVGVMEYDLAWPGVVECRHSQDVSLTLKGNASTARLEIGLLLGDVSDLAPPGQDSLYRSDGRLVRASRAEMPDSCCARRRS